MCVDMRSLSFLGISNAKFLSFLIQTNFWQEFLLPKVINAFYTEWVFQKIAKKCFSALHSMLLISCCSWLSFATIFSSQEGKKGQMDGMMMYLFLINYTEFIFLY